MPRFRQILIAVNQS